jgi:uncharacterized membrane protein YagU involved in acid resistance
MEKLVRGAVAGLIATGPMTWTMRAAERLVPWPWQGRLPPRQITERVLHKAGVKQKFDEDDRSALSIAAHYEFGTAAGAMLGAVASPQGRIPRHLVGAAIGLSVWAASYLGWLPAAGIRRSATKEPAGRNIQIIAAHIVWGCVAGALLDRISGDKEAS